MKDIVKIPSDAEHILRVLNHMASAEAYVVGGCVRDSLMGKEPHDWDICTSAKPEEVKACFERTIDTGLKHGTVTIPIGGEAYEVTTFRTDGEYSDGRHPDSVEFVQDVKEDLARRDFTVNAMAYHPEVGLIDPFDGAEDIRRRRIASVGNPEDRFNEDALRILRAMRFASTYGFTIDEDTAEAMHKLKHLLKKVSAERIREELCKMLMGEGILDILLNFSDIIAEIIPELKPCIGFDQNNKYHQYTVYDHIAHAVSNYKGDSVAIKVSLLLHDIGKPKCYSEDERGGHFYGHALPSSKIAKRAVSRLRFDNKTAEQIVKLVEYHDQVLDPTPRVVKRAMYRIGADVFEMLLDVRMADILAHAEGTQESRIERCNGLRKIYEEIIAAQECFTLKDLAVNGTDLKELGYEEGKEIGNTLRKLLDAVINGEVENEKTTLLMIAAKEPHTRVAYWKTFFQCSICGEISTERKSECPFCHAKIL